jgi:Xaa-Pro aminopeptidase
MPAIFYKKLCAVPAVKCVDTIGIVERIRQVKQSDELRAIRQSQRLNEQVLKLTLEHLKFSMSEADAVWLIRQLAHDIGADGLSFEPIVAFGAHTSMPHHQSHPKKKLKRGDMILIDMGLVYKNYCSDMTRTFFTKTPTKQQADMYQTVLTAQRAAIAGTQRSAASIGE